MFQKSGGRVLGQVTSESRMPYPKIPEAWQRLRSALEFFYVMYLKRTGNKLARIEAVFNAKGLPVVTFYLLGPIPTPPPGPLPQPPHPPSPGPGMGGPVRGIRKPSTAPRVGEVHHGKVVDIYNPYESF
jgi:hypothetical protein